MLFGSPDSFAIEAFVEPDLQAPSAVRGRMRVWCGGAFIGDITEEHCGLGSSCESFKELQRSLPMLWLPEFECLSDAALWNLFDGLLYGFHGDVELVDGRSLAQLHADAAHYSRFNFLTNWGEQFDRSGKSFIVCTPAGIVRIFNRSFPGSIRREAPLDDVLRTIAGFAQWFDREAARLTR